MQRRDKKGPMRRMSVRTPRAAAGRRISTDMQDDVSNGDFPVFESTDVEMDYQPIEMRRVPEDQIQLTEEEKADVFTRTITATNPNSSKAIVRFNYEQGKFIPEGKIDHLAIHFSMPGVLVHKDSDVAQQQRRYLEQKNKLKASSKLGLASALEKKRISSHTQTDFKKPNDDSLYPEDQQLKNQFNFSERATQTFNNPMRDRKVKTEPPPTKDFCFQITQWEIFDTYLCELERTLAAKESRETKKTRTKPKSSPADEAAEDAESAETADVMRTASMARAVKLMERMVNQNSDPVYTIKERDSKLEEKASERETKRDERGTFLPLWRFTYEEAHRKTVTSLCWNPEFTDLFAVGYGSYDFGKQGEGLICCYTLKNTSHPEYVFHTEAGVMSLDFHPQHSALLVAGLYDGTVVVFDVRSKSDQPLYASTNPKTKHTDPVWQVHWQPEVPGKNTSFYSVSSDGRVTNWILNKNELTNEEVVQLKLVPMADEEEDIEQGEQALVGSAGGCCFDFNQSDEHLFIVGTEEGAIHSYSKAYSSQYLRSYGGHHMSCYALRWNPYHPNVFLSCSADWTVKLWDKDYPDAVLTFDLGCAVADVAWAPWSATTFAVVTTDGKLRIFDLDIDKHAPVGMTRVKQAPLTHVVFNPKDFIVCVGDKRGVVNILKLTGNLKKISAPKVEDIDPEEEVQRLQRQLIADYPENAREAHETKAEILEV